MSEREILLQEIKQWLESYSKPLARQENDLLPILSGSMRIAVAHFKEHINLLIEKSHKKV